MLYRIYKQHGITLKKKQMDKTSFSNRSPEEVMMMIAELQQQLIYYSESGHKLIYIDECSFTIKHTMESTWRAKGDSFTLNYPR